jgi:hypothetical protein
MSMAVSGSRSVPRIIILDDQEYHKQLFVVMMAAAYI